MKKIGLPFLFAMVLMLSSCIKIEDKSVKDYLTDDTWKGVSYKILLSDGSVFASGTLNATLEFKENGRYHYENSDDGIIEDGDWQLQNDDKEIYMEPDNDSPQTLYIDHLDDDNFECHTMQGGFRANYRFTQD